jgi:hypothetical protein
LNRSAPWRDRSLKARAGPQESAMDKMLVLIAALVGGFFAILPATAPALGM